MLTGMPLDMSSFYLPNGFSFFPESSHSETTLHHGVSPLAQANENHLHDNKHEKKYVNESEPRSNVHYSGSSENKA